MLVESSAGWLAVRLVGLKADLMAETVRLRVEKLVVRKDDNSVGM